jgi:hypothetical protein
VDIETLLNAASGSEVFLEETEWMEGVSARDLERAYSDYSARFERWLARLREKLGEPQVTRSSHPELADDLYPEAFEFAAWRHGSGYRVLACGQHDRDTPVFVSFGYREADAV